MGRHSDVMNAKPDNEESKKRLVEELKRRGNLAFKAVRWFDHRSSSLIIIIDHHRSSSSSSIIIIDHHHHRSSSSSSIIDHHHHRSSSSSIIDHHHHRSSSSSIIIDHHQSSSIIIQWFQRCSCYVWWEHQHWLFLYENPRGNEKQILRFAFTSSLLCTETMIREKKCWVN